MTLGEDRVVKDLAKLAMYYHLLDEVKVAVLRDLGHVRSEDGWELISRGEEASLPLWLALTLESKGYIELRDQRISDVDISKYLLIEKSLKGSEFLKLKNTFYVETSELLSKLRKLASKEDMREVLLRLVRVEADLKDLIRMRLRKIVQIALLGKEPEDYFQSLLLEERVLLRKLSETIKQWMKVVISHE